MLMVTSQSSLLRRIDGTRMRPLESSLAVKVSKSETDVLTFTFHVLTKKN
jgi:hypothetical protein